MVERLLDVTPPNTLQSSATSQRLRSRISSRLGIAGTDLMSSHRSSRLQRCMAEGLDGFAFIIDASLITASNKQRVHLASGSSTSAAQPLRVHPTWYRCFCPFCERGDGDCGKLFFQAP
jgi:hypothetical protein